MTRRLVASTEGAPLPGPTEVAARLVAERRRAEHAERLAETFSQIGTADGSQDIVEALLCGAVALLGGERGVVHVFGGLLGIPRAHVIVDAGGAVETRAAPPPVRPDTFAAALQAGAPAGLVEDSWATEHSSDPAYAALKGEGYRSALHAPLDAGGRRIGSLHLTHRRRGFFAPAHLALAEALAAHAGRALDRIHFAADRDEARRQLAAQAEVLARHTGDAATLRQLDRLKSELLGTMSHELRTPLTVVFGYAQRLKARAATLDAAAVERMSEQILTSTRQLIRLVNDLLDFSRLERGEISLEITEFDLVPAIHGLLAIWEDSAIPLRVAQDLPPALPVRADRARVEHVLMNLLENAIQYAPESAITVRGRVAGDIIRVEVEDGGAGIPPQEQLRVWEKLYRGRRVAQLNVSRGSGVGLSVVRTLIEAQGGRVGLRSVPGQGACFWFELPRAS